MWARQGCCSVASSEVRSLVRIDLLGEPAWRDCTCGSGSVSAANCQPWVLEVSLDLWTGGNA